MLLQLKSHPIKNTISKIAYPVTEIDVFGVFAHSEFHGQMAVSENKVIVVFGF